MSGHAPCPVCGCEGTLKKQAYIYTLANGMNRVEFPYSATDAETGRAEVEKLWADKGMWVVHVDTVDGPTLGNYLP